MALIFRSILDVQDAEFPTSGAELFQDWLRWKLSDPELELPPDREVLHLDDQREVRVSSGEHGSYAGFRGSLFEPRDTEQVRTTFTALTRGDDSWSWVDLERWSDDPFSAGWVPMSPGIVQSILRNTDCRRGATRLGPNY